MFVDKAVSDAGHVWNDTRRDFGIDGHIEFVDTAAQVTGYAVGAQVKGTAVASPARTRRGSGSRAGPTILTITLACLPLPGESARRGS